MTLGSDGEFLPMSVASDRPMALTDAERAELELRAAKLERLMEVLDEHLEVLGTLGFEAALRSEDLDERIRVAPLKRELRDWLDMEHERVGLALHARVGETRLETAYRLAFEAMHKDGADAPSARVW
jgi:hypothetical protein